MKIFKRGQRGFTLVELMVVMAIIAVLAAIVIPPVTGTKQTSADTQVKQDATNVQTEVGKFNSAANLAEEITESTHATILDISNGDDDEISNKWPEKLIQDAYTVEFPNSVGNANNTTASVTILNKDATVVYSGNLTVFLARYNAVDFAKLTGLAEEPNGVDAMFSNQRPFHNYLWLVLKLNIDSNGDGDFVDAGEAGAGRNVEVYSLTKVQKNNGSGSALTYQRIQ